MVREPISTDRAPGAIGPYSQAMAVEGRLIFLSGQIPLTPAGEMIEGGVVEQAEQALSNVKGLLESHGLSTSNVVKSTVFLADMADFAAVNEVYAKFFEEPYPARSAVAVKGLPKGVLVEIECIAAV